MIKDFSFMLEFTEKMRKNDLKDTNRKTDIATRTDCIMK